MRRLTVALLILSLLLQLLFPMEALTYTDTSRKGTEPIPGSNSALP
jgi:hypothetical protein